MNASKMSAFYHGRLVLFAIENVFLRKSAFLFMEIRLNKNREEKSSEYERCGIRSNFRCLRAASVTCEMCGLAARLLSPGYL